MPALASEADERAWWERAGLGSHFDGRKAARARLPNLKPGAAAVSLRLPVSLSEQIKIAASKRGAPLKSEMVCHFLVISAHSCQEN